MAATSRFHDVSRVHVEPSVKSPHNVCLTTSCWVALRSAGWGTLQPLADVAEGNVMWTWVSASVTPARLKAHPLQAPGPWSEIEPNIARNVVPLTGTVAEGFGGRRDRP